MAELLDGRQLAAARRATIKKQVDALRDGNAVVPGLAVILVGDDPASHVYVRNKKRACDQVGFLSLEVELRADVTQAELIRQIGALNDDPMIHGILVQLPLPSHIDSQTVIESIDPAKDVDGFHPYNVGRLATGLPEFVPCTPLGVMALLAHHQVSLTGKRALVIGRSNIVGKPMAQLLLQQHATVILAHSRTHDLPAEVAQADIVVAAIGKPDLIRGDWIKPGAVVVDVGINQVPDPHSPQGYRLVGDIEFAAAERRASFITPVPGGTGPMTIAMLLENTLRARELLVRANPNPN